MYKKYVFPLQIFLILEKSNILFWNSKSLTPNSYVCLLSYKWFYTLNLILRNELFLNSSFLVENTAIDTRFMNNVNNKLNLFFNNNKLLNCYIYYFLNLKLRLIFLINLKNNYKPYMYSIDKIFNNANWLERETSEMYGILYYFKYDMRKLLLDYSKIENPLLKDFSSEGIQDVFYNFFENQVSINKSEVIEL
uniref:NADH dehydrogenase subunit 9 n=1 Tax=Uronema marinum TaxID=35107 RepID=A0A345WJW5_UROMR|nr:NADH dehydrogenase subunit 9 [Uronema marinum]AXJ93358.1 NADH dehydrogenase subunit 9 [Uronema marinum]